MLINKRVVLDFIQSGNKDFIKYLSDKGYTGICVLPVNEIIFGPYNIEDNKIRGLLNMGNTVCALKGNKTNYLPFVIKPIYKKKLFKKVFDGYKFVINGRVSLLSDIHSFAVEI